MNTASVDDPFAYSVAPDLPSGYREVPISIDSLAASFGLKDAWAVIQGSKVVLVGRKA